MPQATRLMRLLGGGLLLGITILLIAASLSAPRAKTFDIGDPGDAYVAINFYDPEQSGSTSFRWSGPNTSLQLPRLYGGASALRLRLHSTRPDTPLYLYLPIERYLPAVLPTGGDWRVYSVLLPTEELHGAGDQGALALVAPLIKPGSDDPRELGVAVDWVRLQPLVSAPNLGALLTDAGLLLWLAALVAGAARLAIGVVAPSSGHGLMLGWGFFLVLALGLGTEAVNDSAALQAALGLEPAWLAGATLALATLAVALRYGRAGALPRRLPRAALVALLALPYLILVLPLPGFWRSIAAVPALWLPGALLALLLAPPDVDLPSVAFLALCGGLTVQVVLTLASVALPVGVLGAPLGVLCAALTAGLGWRLLQRRGSLPRAGGSLPLVLVLLLAAALRLPSLGGHELHDDEASVLLAATRLVAGQGDVLLAELKGPVQVLLPAGPLALSGHLSELAARLSFAMAGMGVVLGGYLLARELLQSSVAATIAGAVLALDGLLIAFSRIVQYQSMVVLLTMGALWCTWRFAREQVRPGPYLGVAALFIATALLGHYDALFGIPALLWLVVLGGVARRWGPAGWARGLATPLLVGGGLLACFYVPFVLSPNFPKVVAHLGERTGQQGGPALYNNLMTNIGLASFYSSGLLVSVGAWTLAASLVLLAVGRLRPRWLSVGVAGLVLLSVADLSRGPGASLLASSAPLGLLALGTPLLALAFSPRVEAGPRALLLWFSFGFLAMSFLVAQPRTHIYVTAAPAIMIVAMGGAALLTLLRRRAPELYAAAALAGAMLILVAALYAHVLFVRQTPEYLRGFPSTRLAMLSASQSETPIDEAARFGFPSRDGWKAVGELYRQGVLSGPFASNLSTEVTAWYTRGLYRCNAPPAYYLIALASPNAAIPPDYGLFGMVTVDGVNRIAIYSQEQPGASVRYFELDRYVQSFDAQPVPTIPTGSERCAADGAAGAGGATPREGG